MPLYEYQCQECKKVHEVMQKFSDPLLKECPDCHGAVQKLMSLSAFSLKGTGWYTTDYKKGSSSTSASIEKSTSASSGSSTESKCSKGSCDS